MSPDDTVICMDVIRSPMDGSVPEPLVDRAPRLVSVVIPTRNRLALLKEAVVSVQAQTLSSWRLIVVDDASEDGTSGWLANLADLRILAVRLEQRAERSAARNHGLSLAQSEFVLFLDDDDRLFPSALERLVSALALEPGAVMAIGGRVVFSESGERRRLPHTRRRLTRSVMIELVSGWVPSPGQCLLRTEAVQACGQFDETLTVCEDCELWLKLSKLGPAVLVPPPVLEYRLHAGQKAPANSDEVLDNVRRAAIDGLAGKDRQRAERVFEASSLVKHATAFYSQGSYGRGLKSYLAACLKAPALARSPILGPGLLSQIAKSVVGFVVGTHVAMVLRRMRRTAA